ncbi:hypothetical protein [Microbacterium trichothecenolyticum]|uniref:Membrane-bound acyltransferase YfiQ involved in biofilm formation n=1 Tax=Microbacterium trichothecenolyticum TaxID=69370 RepID=A0ABU0TY83_MICTR|nr:hypothetical protein [Microbacterium trichothecenolyticum]MDQ1124615.1 membrane-bound acyltransferase YfiQ involved in biofilm formation [Microbacterium trichothecenolyticum]
MSNTPAPNVGKARLWLNSFIMGVFASCGYLIVALINQHDILTVVISMAAIAVVLTPVFYWLNSRRAKMGDAPKRP